MYDASIDKNVLVRCPVLSVLANNPRASEFELHLGSCAKKNFAENVLNVSGQIRFLKVGYSRICACAFFTFFVLNFDPH